MHDDKLTRYFAGEMSDAERAGFERELEHDAALRNEVEEVRALMADACAWMEEPAPGVERAASIPVPRINDNRTAARVVPVVWLWRVAAALALFAAGYWIGGHNKPGEQQPSIAQPPQTSAVKEAQPVQADHASDAMIAQNTTPAETAPYIAREENGRVIIETANAYWVIDPGMTQAKAPIAN